MVDGYKDTMISDRIGGDVSAGLDLSAIQRDARTIYHGHTAALPRYFTKERIPSQR